MEHEYDIILQENDFIDHCELEINTTEPYIVKIRGLAKIKPKEDLFLNILEDKKPYIYLLKIHTEPFEILETKTSNKSKKMICDVSSKKP